MGIDQTNGNLNFKCSVKMEKNIFFIYFVVKICLKYLNGYIILLQVYTALPHFKLNFAQVIVPYKIKYYDKIMLFSIMCFSIIILN